MSASLKTDQTKYELHGETIHLLCYCANDGYNNNNKVKLYDHGGENETQCKGDDRHQNISPYKMN